MLKMAVCIIVLIVTATLFMIACSARETPQNNADKIDVYSLLAELEQKLERNPSTKEECETLLKDIRSWREKRLRDLTNQRSRSPKYGFESQWVPQDYNDSQACTHVLLSDERHVEGKCSLKMMMNLVPGDKNRSKGEALVDMRASPPLGERVPVNMLGRTVTAWVYAPWGARGASDKPNGFQVFVKDAKGKGEYGPWHNIKDAEWFKVSLDVSPCVPKSGYMDVGFDPSQIVIVGVKMAVGDGSNEKYNGPVFVDGVDW